MNIQRGNLRVLSFLEINILYPVPLLIVVVYQVLPPGSLKEIRPEILAEPIWRGREYSHPSRCKSKRRSPIYAINHIVIHRRMKISMVIGDFERNGSDDEHRVARRSWIGNNITRSDRKIFTVSVTQRHTGFRHDKCVVDGCFPCCCRRKSQTIVVWCQRLTQESFERRKNTVSCLQHRSCATRC